MNLVTLIKNLALSTLLVLSGSVFAAESAASAGTGAGPQFGMVINLGDKLLLLTHHTVTIAQYKQMLTKALLEGGHTANEKLVDYFARTAFLASYEDKTKTHGLNISIEDITSTDEDDLTVRCYSGLIRFLQKNKHELKISNVAETMNTITPEPAPFFRKHIIQFIEQGFFDLIQLAHRYKINLNESDWQGSYPLIVAARCGNVEIFKFILENTKKTVSAKVLNDAQAAAANDEIRTLIGNTMGRRFGSKKVKEKPKKITKQQIKAADKAMQDLEEELELEELEKAKKEAAKAAPKKPKKAKQKEAGKKDEPKKEAGKKEAPKKESRVKTDSSSTAEYNAFIAAQKQEFEREDDLILKGLQADVANAKKCVQSATDLVLPKEQTTQAFGIYITTITGFKNTIENLRAAAAEKQAMIKIKRAASNELYDQLYKPLADVNSILRAGQVTHAQLLKQEQEQLKRDQQAEEARLAKQAQMQKEHEAEVARMLANFNAAKERYLVIERARQDLLRREAEQKRKAEEAERKRMEEERKAKEDAERKKEAERKQADKTKREADLARLVTASKGYSKLTGAGSIW